MVSREDAVRALEERDWVTGAEVEREPRPAMIVVSVRLPGELAVWVGDEAERRGVYPSAVIRDLVEQARREASVDETITMRRSDLHRAIDEAVRPAA
ncbi:MAG TPA: hypothetical protein VFB84_14545 [Micromonosporaceae bacterium]|nr:hypothetical protein [Micromonosporaceae bacterium]